MFIIVIIFTLFIISIMALYLRIRLHLGKQSFGGDVFIHLYRARRFKEKMALPRRDMHFLVRQKTSLPDFPLIFPVILSLFPLSKLKRITYLVTPVIDVIQILALFLTAAILFKNPLLGLLAAAIYAVTPSVTLLAGTLTERALGSLFLSMSLMFLVLFEAYGSLYFFATFFIFSILTLLTHKMSTQTLYFTIISFGIVFADPFLLMTPFFLILSAIIVTNGYYLRILRGHLTVIKSWINRPRYGTYLSNFRLAAKLFLYNPFVVVMILQLVLLIPNWSKVPFVLKLIALWAGLIFMYALLTSLIKPLRCLGQGERYLQLNAFPVALFISYSFMLFFRSSLCQMGILGLGAGVSIMAILLSHKRQLVRSQSVMLNTELKKIIRQLKGTKRKNLFALPTNLMRMALYEANTNIVEHMGAADIEDTREFFPRLKVPIKYLILKYSLNYILLWKNEADNVLLELKRNKNAKKVMETSNFVLFDVTSLR